MLNKFYNLYRLNKKNAIIVLNYLFRRIMQRKIIPNQENVYSFYCSLTANNAYFVDEEENSFIIKNSKFSKIRIKLRKIPSSDIQVYNQVFISQEYQVVIDLYKKKFNIQNDYKLNIIDAGSNIGLTSLYFLEYFSNANLICIEPEPENFKIMKYNLKSTLNSGKIIAINGGIWSSNSKLKIVNDFRDCSDWAFRVESTNDDQNYIQAYTISQLASANNYQTIDILKIDIEGSEKEIFTSPKANLDFLKITKIIAIEIHDEFNCREDIYKVLDQYNFEYIEDKQTTIGFNKLLL